MVIWNHPPPAYAHGFIKGYLVFYELGNQSEVTAFNESQIAINTFLEITHLEIFAWYSIQVLAYTLVGIGVKSEVVYVRTKEWGRFAAFVLSIPFSFHFFFVYDRMLHQVTLAPSLFPERVNDVYKSKKIVENTNSENFGYTPTS